MIKVKDIHQLDFDSIPIDTFWNTGDHIEQKMHRIHAYPAKFPAFITTKALEFWNSTYTYTPTRISDIFCGCGTTAFETRRNSIAFWGCDINPVATLIAKTKSRKYQSRRLIRYFDDIIHNFLSTKVLSLYETAPERLKFWYFEKQYNELFHLKESVVTSTPENSDYRLFFLCAFSNILKHTSRWLTKSIKPQIDPLKQPADVFASFQAQFEFMRKANDEVEDAMGVESEIITANVLDDSLLVPTSDMIITSPPYVTSYEYADLHQLSSLWLGFTDDYRTLRSNTIGSRHHELEFPGILSKLNSTGYENVSSLMKKSTSKAKSVAKYFYDMQLVAKKSYTILTSSGMALYLIGNTEYLNVRIENAKHLAESLLDAGFAQVDISKRKISNKILTPYRDEHGRFSTNSSSRKVYSDEFIVIARKAV